MASKAEKLRAILDEDRCHMVPCCWDALSAKMIGEPGFPFTFMSGFAVSAARHPSDQLMSFDDLKRTVGFDAYYEAEIRYAGARKDAAE